MGRNKKRAEKMRRNPKNVPYRDIETLLLSLGFTHRSKGTSHNVFTLEGTPHRLIVPMKRPHVKRFYVEEMLSLIDELRLLEDERKKDDDIDEESNSEQAVQKESDNEVNNDE